MPADRGVRLRGRRGGGHRGGGRHRRRRGGRARRRAQGRRRHRVDDAATSASPSARSSSSTPRATSSTPPPGLPWQADQIDEFGLTPPPADQIAAFAARNAELQPAQHHDRRRRHRRRAEPGRRAAGSRSPPTTAWPAPSGPCHTPLDGDTVFALATGAVEVPPDRETPGGDVAGDAADHRGRRRRGRLSWPARCWSACWPPSRSPEYRPTGTCCPEHSRPVE